MYGRKGKQQQWTSIGQFPLRSKQGDTTKTEGTFGPPILTKCQAKKEYTATAPAITNFAASTRSVNGPTGAGRERDK